MQGEIYVGQIMGEACTYDHANKLYISSGDTDYDMVLYPKTPDTLP